MNETFIDILTKKYESLAINYIKLRVNRIMLGFVYNQKDIMRDIALTINIHALVNNLVMNEEQINNTINILNNITHE